MRKTDQKGFSLPELLVVTLVVAIIVTLALPQIQGALRIYRLDIAERVVTGRLLEARLTAIKRNRDTWLAIDTTANTIQIVSTDDNGTTVFLTPAISLPQNAVFTGATPSSVTYSSLGRNKASGTSVISLQVNGVNKTRAISISATGNLSVTTS
jgi:prepilin-type N-terminal cleavage/methylation domain-containing protein